MPGTAQQGANSSPLRTRDAAEANAARPARWRLPRSSWIAATALLVVLSCVLVAAYRLGPKHWLVVTPDVLYRSALIEPEQLGRVVDRLGVRTVVNLRSVNENQQGDWYATQRGELERRGVEMLDIPLHTGWPPERAQIETWIELMRDPTRHPVLMHCEYGVVRSGMMTALYEIEVLGHDPDTAWSHFEFFGGELRDPVGSRVAEFVQGYVPLAQQE